MTENHQDPEQTLAEPMEPRGQQAANDADASERFPIRDWDRYEILRFLGKGGMGKVYLARHLELGRRVALKLIRRRYVHEGTLARFQAEQQALARLNHHHIAHAYEVGNTADGLPYFTMEYIPGLPITTFCDRHRLTLNARIALFLQVCDGVLHAHEQGVLHRDLKPSNILVTLVNGRPHAKIIDFGIALTLEPESGCASGPATANMIGTPSYMCPEQVLEGRSDARGDIFSLGAVLYELLCGHPALSYGPSSLRSLESLQRLASETDPEPMKTVLGKEPGRAIEIAEQRRLSPRRLRAVLGHELEYIVKAALARDPSHRYPSVSAFQDDLRRYQGRWPISVVPPNWSYLVSSFVRRHKLGLLLSAAVLSMSIVLSILLWQSHKGKKEAEELALEEKRRGDLSNKEMVVAVGIVSELIETTSPYKKGMSATHLDLLKRTEKILDSLSHDQEWLAMVLRRGLGIAYLEMGDFERAESHLRSLYDYNHLNLGPDDEQTREAEYLLTKCLHTKTGDDQGDITRSIEAKNNHLFEQFDTALEVSLSENKRVAIVLYLTLGRVYTELGLYGTAENHLRRLLELNTGLLGSQDPRVLQVKYLLSRCLILDGRPREAIPLLEVLKRKGREWQGPDGLDYYDVMALYASAERLLGENTKAKAHAVDLFQNDSNKSSFEKASNYVILANVLMAERHFEQAAELYEVAIRLFSYAVPKDYPDRLLAMSNLGLCYNEINRPAEAVVLLEKAFRGRLRKLGPTHRFTLKTRRGLARATHLSGDIPLAEVRYRDLITDAAKYLGEDDLITRLTRNNYAVLLSQCGLYDEAIQQYLVLERRYATDAAPNMEYARLLNNLADLYILLNRPEHALPLLDEAMEIKWDLMGAEDFSLVTTMVTLGQAHLGNAEFHDARAVLTEAVRITEMYQATRKDDLSLFRGFVGASMVGTGERRAGMLQMSQSREALGNRSMYRELIENLYEAADRGRFPFDANDEPPR